MENNREKRWLDDVMDSTDGMRRASPLDSLFHKIEQKLEQGAAYAKRVPLTTVSMAAASIALLICLNVTMLKNSRGAAEQTKESEPVETVIAYYGLSEESINF